MEVVVLVMVVVVIVVMAVYGNVVADVPDLGDTRISGMILM